MTPAEKKLRALLGKERYGALRRRFPDYTTRAYQVLAVEQLVGILRRKQNPLLLLDPGLGKTLVSQITLNVIQHSFSERYKALVLVPSRLLRDQHYLAARWFADGDNILNVDERVTRVPGRLRQAFSKASWIISTPKRLSNALDRDYRLRTLLKELSLCVVDEFDAQAAEDVDYEGEPIGRFSEAGASLIEEIKRNRSSFLCMSATQRAAATPWLELFDLVKVEIPKGLINEYSAFVRFNRCSIVDERAVEMDSAISLIVVDALRKIRHAVTGEFLVDPEIDPDHLYQQASRIIEGSRSHLYFPPPINRAVDVEFIPRLRSLLGRFLQAYSHRLFLFEGRLEAIEFTTYQRVAIRKETGERLKVKCAADISYSRKATPTRKLDALLTLLKKRHNQRCLILVRNTDVNAFISGLLLANGIDSRSITGQVSDEQRRSALALFNEGTLKTLVVNRQIGGRGFDLPKADFGIFISPKRSEETMWQETLRIRGTKRRPKDVYVLFFERTKEEEKMDALLSDIELTQGKYKVLNCKLDLHPGRGHRPKRPGVD